MEAIPTNPFNGLNTVTSAAADPGAAGGAGWFFNSTTGQVRPDDDKTSPDGVAHIAL
jgi:hypothetical protein